MGKIARELSAALDENLAPTAPRRPFKAEEWQLQDTGDMINTKTGEILDPEDLERLARGAASDSDPSSANPFDDDEYSQVARPKAGRRG